MDSQAFDYQEFVLLHNSQHTSTYGEDYQLHTYDIPKHKFDELIHTLKGKGMKCFQQDIIETYHNTLQRLQYIESC